VRSSQRSAPMSMAHGDPRAIVGTEATRQVLHVLWQPPRRVHQVA
jgi:hypothetical protein